ncbi:MAG TPA: hypothetical protein VF533_06290 [Solirubrobacteraceae bacterium]
MSGDSKEPRGGLSVQTLVISSISAVAASVIVSQFWESGTLIFTAMVPIVVALVSEALKRPAEKITQVAPLVVPVRRPSTGTAVYQEAPGEPRVPQEARRALPEREDRFGLYEDARRSDRGRRWVRVGLITGLVAFLVGAATVTASELAIFGSSVGGGDRKTTYFGGTSSSSKKKSVRETKTGEKPAPGATATPSPQATPAPDDSATPAPTETPAATATPAPEATEPPASTPAPEETDPAAP